jgi:hypothetical protein
MCIYIYTCYLRYDSLYVIYYMYICMCVYIYTENVNVFFLQKRLGEAFGKVMVNISCWQS